MLVRHVIRSSAALLLCLTPRLSRAQSTTSLLPDATVLPQRALRIRALTAWTRWDELLGTADAPRNIAATFAVDSLGSAQLPALASSEASIRAVSGLTNFRLTAGKIAAAADSRVVTAPLIIEFGLSSRLTLGLVVPLVETRTTVNATLNATPGNANVGPNPALTSSAVRSQNAAFVQSMITAAATLTSRLAQCQTTPTGTGCSTLLGQQAAAQALVQASGVFASSIAQLYGTSATTPGRAFIPLASDASQTAIAANIAAMRAQYKSFLNGVDPIAGTISGANGPAGRNDLQSLLLAAGHDSVRTIDHASIGDITVGATYQLVNTYPIAGDSAPAGRRYRVAVNGGYRIGTGQPANRNRLFDNATGYGQPGVEAGVAADLELTRRWSASAIGSYTLQLGSVDVNRVPNALGAAFPLDVPYTGSYSAGNVLSLSIVPRYRISGYFGLTGQYSLVHAAGDQYSGITSTAAPDPAANTVAPVNPGLTSSTAQQIGVGVTYSTIIGGDRGPGRIPFEVAFSHLETIAASGGPTPKAFRDQVSVRLYFTR